MTERALPIFLTPDTEHGLPHTFQYGEGGVGSGSQHTGHEILLLMA